MPRIERQKRVHAGASGAGGDHSIVCLTTRDACRQGVVQQARVSRGVQHRDLTTMNEIVRDQRVAVSRGQAVRRR